MKGLDAFDQGCPWVELDVPPKVEYSAVSDPQA